MTKDLNTEALYMIKIEMEIRGPADRPKATAAMHTAVDSAQAAIRRSDFKLVRTGYGIPRGQTHE